MEKKIVSTYRLIKKEKEDLYARFGRLFDSDYGRRLLK